ncbi:MAG: DUF2076 domain-containing protein [Rhizobium sp.]|nr:DUF2076 domain-containing protein [Rhizobium sp.]
MSPDERQMLSGLFDRVRGAAATERDREAEALIEARLREQPYSTYYLAQAVLIQDQALKATTDRIQELEAQVRDLEDEGRRLAEQPQSAGFLGGLGSLFGGGQQRMEPARASRDATGSLYRDHQQASQSMQASQQRAESHSQATEADPSPWGRQPASAAGPWSRPAAPGSGGFLQGAMSTAAGVAGGMLLANAVQDLFADDATKTAATPPAPAAENTADAGDKTAAEPEQEMAEAEDDGGFDIFGGDDESFV